MALRRMEPIKVELEIAALLIYLYRLVGLRRENFPSETETDDLTAYIVENYSGHTVDEIKLAFKMAVAGKLDLEPRDVKCYENFSIIYFAQIMTSYRVWASKQAAQLPYTPERVYSEDDKKQINENYRQALLSDAFERFLKVNKLPCKL